MGFSRCGIIRALDFCEFKMDRVEETEKLGAHEMGSTKRHQVPPVVQGSRHRGDPVGPDVRTVNMGKAK